MQKFQTSRMLPVPLPREPEPRTHRLRRTVGLQAAGPDVKPEPHTHRLRARPTLPRDQPTRVEAVRTSSANTEGLGQVRHAPPGEEMATETQHQPRTQSVVPDVWNGPRSCTHRQQGRTQGVHSTEDGKATEEDSPKHQDRLWCGPEAMLQRHPESQLRGDRMGRLGDAASLVRCSLL